MYEEHPKKQRKKKKKTKQETHAQTQIEVLRHRLSLVGLMIRLLGQFLLILGGTGMNSGVVL